jgi:hypothetical protein
MKANRIITHSSVLVLLVSLVGCTCELQLRNPCEHVVMDPVMYLSDKPVVVQNFKGDPEDVQFFKAVVRSLDEDYSMEVIRGSLSAKCNKVKRCDYAVDIRIEPRYEGSWVNFLLTFPGFILFAPSWNGYYYDAVMETRVCILDSKGKVLREVEESPVFELNYMDFGRSFFAYSGWWMPGLGATSLLAAPYMATYDEDASSPLQDEIEDIYGQKIADRIVDAINQLDEAGTSGQGNIEVAST